MESLINGILTILLLLLTLSIIVLVHELGHFLSAKLFKVTVKEFAIGFGRILYSKKYNGTLYAFRAIPLGGFVELEGEQAVEGPNSFRNKHPLVKVIILGAGVVMNLILATVLFAIFLGNNGHRFTIPAVTDYEFHNTSNVIKAFPITIVSVDPEGNSKDQLFEGDTMIGIGGTRFSSFSEFQEKLKSVQDSEQDFEFINISDFTTNTRTIRVGKANEQGQILNAGLNFDQQSGYSAYFIQYNNNITAGVSITYDLSIYQLKAIGSLLSNAFATGNYTEVSKNVGGLPAISNQVGSVVEFRAFEILIPLAGLISISLAIFNILPFPALDGGQIAIVLAETVTRKKVPDSILSKINLFGFVFLIGLAIVINLKDVIQLGWVENIGNFFKNILGR